MAAGAFNGYYLIKIYRINENFTLLEFGAADPLVAEFLNFYKADIQSYFPEFRKISPEENIRFVVLRNLVIANIFSAYLLENGTARVNINYTVPKYRDYKVGKYIFENEKKYLLSRAVKRIIYDQEINKRHGRFLKVMGFKEETLNGKKRLVKGIMPIRKKTPPRKL